jgi:hypothetical protein
MDCTFEHWCREGNSGLPTPQVALKSAVGVARVEAEIARLDYLGVAVHKYKVCVVARTLERLLQELVAPEILKIQRTSIGKSLSRVLFSTCPVFQVVFGR